MVIVDTRLAEREASGTPIRVGLVGAGAMGRMAALQLLTPLTGMRLAAIAARTADQASHAYRGAGIDEIQTVESAAQLTEAVRRNRAAVTEDALLLCDSDSIDVIIEATGSVEFGASVVLRAIDHGKHVILANTELDATLGAILKTHADRRGVVVSNIDGSDAGIAMNLVRYVRTLGLCTVGAGIINAAIDRSSTPLLLRASAEESGQHPAMAASFADGTKLMMDAAILANASGFRAGQRGMFGPRCIHVKEIVAMLPADQLLNGGLVDYVRCAEPYAGAFVIVHELRPARQKYLTGLKLGTGPFYVFYTPYRMPHLQLASSVARAALFHDATTAAIGAPLCTTIAVAKKDLREGEILDGVGGYTCYGTLENAPLARAQQLLPIGLSEGCRLQRKIAKDAVLTFGDIVPPSNRVCDRLFSEQNALFV